MQAVDEGESLVEVSDYVLTHSQASVPGVYAIYDTHRAPQLISYSEDMFNQIKVRPCGRHASWWAPGPSLRSLNHSRERCEAASSPRAA